MAKRSINFSGGRGKHLTVANLVAAMKAVGKTDEEIIEAVKDLQSRVSQK